MKVEIAEKHKQLEQKRQKIAQDENDSYVIEQDIKSLDDQKVNVQVALNTGETALEVNAIENERTRKNLDREKLFDDVKKRDEHLQRIKKALQLISEYQSVSSCDFSLLAYGEKEAHQRNDMLIDIESMFQETEKNMQEKRSDAMAEEKVLSETLSRLSGEIKDLERNKISYNRNAIMLKEAIEREFIARGISSNVYILVELLEISDNKWQNAVEGYMNTQRSYIIVAPQYYDIAAEVYDRNKSKIHTAAIVNTAKLKTNITPDDNSLATVVQSENIYARTYVNDLLGSVMMCERVSQLKEYAIAITQGCMLYQRNALRKINPETYRMPYIGKYALAQQLKLKKAEYEEKSDRKGILETEIKKLESALDAERNCNFETLREVINASDSLQKVEGELKELETKLEDMKNNPTYIQLQIEKEKVEKQLRVKGKELDKIKAEITLGRDQVERLSDDMHNLHDNVKALQVQIEELSRGVEIAQTEAKKRLEAEKKANSDDRIFVYYPREKKKLEKKKSEAVITLIEQQSKYKDGVLGTGIEMMPSYSEEYGKLVKQDLIHYEEKLREIKENCEIEFRESFLAKMRENIEKAIELFNQLNKMLKPIYYGNDSYQFRCEADKEKKRFYEMIRSKFNLDGFNLFSTQFDKAYHDEMEDLFSKLTASDEYGDDVIREYTDYRNYLDYDIDIVPKHGRKQKLSQVYREKSGGETQTPYYVAIAASFVQLYSVGETIRVILLDEAFDKMDEERMESMLKFF